MYSWPLSLSFIFNGGLGGTIFSFLAGAAAGAWTGGSAILVPLLFSVSHKLRLTGAERVEDDGQIRSCVYSRYRLDRAMDSCYGCKRKST